MGKRFYYFSIQQFKHQTNPKDFKMELSGILLGQTDKEKEKEKLLLVKKNL
jgi:hypothetical protein